MARVLLCATGLASAVSSAAAGRILPAAADATALLQQSRASARTSPEAGLEALGGDSLDFVHYAFERYGVGELVEGRGPNGKWFPCVLRRLRRGNHWDVHVLDKFPGFEVPNVPLYMLRRYLGPNESDWYVDNRYLHHQGSGIKYRLSKSMSNTSTDYAPWNTRVVGSNEGDGWVKVSRGYLPMHINGKPVLTRRERRPEQSVAPAQAFVHWYEEREVAWRKTVAPTDPPPPPPLKYNISEKVRFMSKAGEWHQAQVTSLGRLPDTYTLSVLADDGRLYAVHGVQASRLKKVGPPTSAPADDESSLCQKQGCVLLRARTDSGREYVIRAAMLEKVESIMKSACNHIRLPWERCMSRINLTRNGQRLDTSMSTWEAGFKDNEVVDLKLAPEARELAREVLPEMSG